MGSTYEVKTQRLKECRLASIVLALTMFIPGARETVPVSRKHLKFLTLNSVIFMSVVLATYLTPVILGSGPANRRRFGLDQHVLVTLR